MKQTMVRLLAVILMLSLSIGWMLETTAWSKPAAPKICVFSFRSTGPFVDGLKSYLAYLSGGLGFRFDVRFAGDDAATFYKGVESAIAEGYNGIVSLTDKGNTNEIVELCAENKVYFGGAWHNQAATLNASKAGFNFLGNKYYVGNLTDCEDDMATPIAIYCAAAAKAYKALKAADQKGSIGIVIMPFQWQPAHQIGAENIYNTLRTTHQIPESAFATSGSQVKVRSEDVRVAGRLLKAGTIQWPAVDATSRSLPSIYFEENPRIKLLVSTVAFQFLEPTLQTVNLHGKIKVWCTAFDTKDALTGNFGSKGDSTYQGVRTAPVEGVAFPLIQILDKLAEKSYADKEEYMAKYYGKKIEKTNFALKDYLIPTSSSIVISTDKQMDAMLKHYLYGTGKGSDTILTVDETKGLMKAYKNQATYEALVAKFGPKGGLDIDKILKFAASK